MLKSRLQQTARPVATTQQLGCVRACVHRKRTTASAMGGIQDLIEAVVVARGGSSGAHASSSSSPSPSSSSPSGGEVRLPVADSETVARLEREAAEAATHAPKDAYAAKLRLAWALAHSSAGHAHYVRARHLVGRMLREARAPPAGDAQAEAELLYLMSVARLNAADLVGAHQSVSTLLAVSRSRIRTSAFAPSPRPRKPLTI